jgi:uncharacterized membrane protein
MTWRELWLFLHISGAIVWIGGATLAQVLGVLAQRSRDPARTAALGRDMAFVGPKVFLPASLLVLLTGIALTRNEGWDWTEPFIVFGLVGWAAVAFTAFVYITRTMGALGARMATAGPSPELIGQMNRVVLVARVLVLVLFVIVFMMVVKLGT